MLDGEKVIIESAVRGESSAFGLLYDHYQPKIYRVIGVKVARREEAEDLTHQVFLSAWQSIGSYKDVGYPFSSWLYRIARNQVIDHYRTRKVSVGLDEVDPNLFATESHESLAHERFELDRVLAAIRRLKPEYQDVIMMRFVEDLPVRDVALAIDKSEGAVKLIQHRALKQLKDILASEPN
ncbi:MAG: sigma-70 family RNA polymerase sigma factor [Patescibacteria group bacterium]